MTSAHTEVKQNNQIEFMSESNKIVFNMREKLETKANDNYQANEVNVLNALLTIGTVAFASYAVVTFAMVLFG